MRIAATVCALLAALVFAPTAMAQNAARAPAPLLSEQPVGGTSIRRMQAATVIQAPLEVVVAQVLDYARYPEFLRRFRSARVVRRNRAQTDVYFQLELPRAMGIVWFVQQMSVVQRSADRLEIQGFARSGNAGRVETRVLVERIPGPVPSTRFTFTLLGVPVVPALPDTVNDTLRDAVRAAAVGLRARVEHEITVARP